MFFKIEESIFKLQHLKRSGLATDIDATIDGLNKDKFDIKVAHTHAITETSVEKCG